MSLARRSNLALAVIVVVYFAFGVAHLAQTPMFEKPDEEWHAAYVYYLLEQRSLPPLVIDAEQNPAVQIAGHPPLYYAVAASLLRATGLTKVPPALQANPFWGYPAQGTTPDNKNRFLHTAGELDDPRYRPLYLLRGLSLLLGVGAVFAAYGIGLALTQQMALALMSAALVAVLPQYSFIASSVSNDALVATLSGLGLLALVHAAAQEGTWRHWVWFGLLAGLAALTKTSALLLPIFGAAVAILLGIRRRSWRVGAVGVASSLGLWLAFSGWWYARNFLQFDDPLGVGVHVAAYGRPITFEGWRLLDQWQATSVTFWAAFGWSNVQFPGWVYGTLRALEALALIGLLAYLLRQRRRLSNGTMWAVALGYTGLTILAYLWWTTTVTGTLGRLLFPALAPLAVLMVRGLSHWSHKALAAAWSFVAVIALLAPAFIMPAYRAPDSMFAVSGGEQRAAMDVSFGTLARLVDAQVSPQRLAPGEAVTARLCWQPLSASERDYVLFVQILDEANRKVGERTTYPGLGRYPTSQWRPGQQFCDVVEVPTDAAASAPAVYSVVAGLYDLETGENVAMADAKGDRLGLLRVAQIKLLGPSPSLPASAVALDANFADLITLAGYEIGPLDAAGQLPLTLYWQAQAPIQSDYTVFVHLVSADGQRVAQADSPPQQGRYPSRFWDVGETVSDQHTLQWLPELAAGDYSILVGLYLPETGDRLRLATSGESSFALPLLPSQP